MALFADHILEEDDPSNLLCSSLSKIAQLRRGLLYHICLAFRDHYFYEKNSLLLKSWRVFYFYYHVQCF